MPDTPSSPEGAVRLRSIALEITSRCNQRCVYCYNAWRGDHGLAEGDLPLARLRELVDRLVADVAPKYFTLTGGEPLSRPDILELINHVNGRGRGVVIISNAGLVTEELARALAARRVHYIQVTLAGPDAETHDTLCGPGAFEGTTRGARLLREHGLTVGGSVLCAAHNAHLVGETLLRFEELGISQLVFNRLNPSGYGLDALARFLPTRTQVLDALEAVEAFAAPRELHVTNTMPIPLCMVDTARFPHLRFGQCSAGTIHGEYAVTPEGGVKLCTLQRHTIGSLWEQPLSELVSSDAVQAFRCAIPEFCKGCPKGTTCLGGCGAAAEWAYGSPSEVDPFLGQHVRGVGPDPRVV